ncbi:MAG: serine hydrolase [Candidatus Promineifilaceae bacterium]|nr:serine hydrolase [Candidatus Promineifilaceae bacterium]
MNNSRSTPGMGQWLVVTFIVASVVFLLYKVYQYGSVRQYFPTGLTVAAVDVGGLTREQAANLLNERYLEAEVVLYHQEQSISIRPTEDARFQLDIETMLNQADYQRAQQDFWSGFWGFLWDRPIEVEMVPLRATHDEVVLRRTLETIKGNFDTQPQPPQPVPATLSFEYGEAGMETAIEPSMEAVVHALYRPTQREARLVLQPVAAARPRIGLLGMLIVNHLENQDFDGVASVFILDLEKGEEVRVEAGAAMSGMDLLKVPLVIEAFRFIDAGPTETQQAHITEALLTTEPGGPTALLNMIAGQDNPYVGARQLTDSLWQLGLKNSFMALPYGQPALPGLPHSFETPANTALELAIEPDPAIQTTAEDMGAILAMLYYCAETGGGALRAAYPDQLTQAECQQVIDFMKGNRIGSLVEEGVPPGTEIAHRHGWVGDTHADAAIVFSPGGDYVIVQIFYQREWLPWEQSSPLIADISRATYNYFNFDNPYLEGTRVR